MTSPDAPGSEFAELMCDLTEGRISPAQVGRLNELLCADPANAQHYVDYMLVVTGLRWMAGDEDPNGPTCSIKNDMFLESVQPVSEPPHAILDAAAQPSACGLPPSPPLGFLGSASGVIGYMSSGWPVAYLLATAILGIGLTISAMIQVSHPGQVVLRSPLTAPGHAATPESDSVGRITGMVDCRWERKGLGIRDWGLGRSAKGNSETPERQSLIPNSQSLVHLGDTFAVASGLLEITYNTGARVILQGPVTYEVDSAAGGYLSIGKLTAKLEKRSAVSGQRSETANQESEIINRKSLSPAPCPLFSVRTPTAIVTDLGTEFGVEVSKEGTTRSHVFRGSVKVELLDAGTEKSNRTMVLHENESVHTQRDADANKPTVQLIRVKPDARAFVRRMEMPVATLDLRDIVAGGDGRVQRGPRGLNDLNNMEETVLAAEAGAGQKPRRIGSADKLIDCIFLPDGSQGTVSLDSAGHTFDGFPKTNGTSKGSICATAVGVASKDKATPSQRGLLGLRSNAGITFDLAAMRDRYADVRPTRFRASVFCGSSAGAATLFEDDFQSDKAGTMPRDANRVLAPAIAAGDVGGYWSCDPGNGTTVQLWNNVHPGKPVNDAGTNNYLKVLDGNGPLTATGWDANITANSQVEVSFSIWKDSTKPAWSGVAGFVDRTENERTFSVYFGSDGVVSYYDGSGMVDTGIRYPTDTWQNVTISTDMATQTYSLTVGNATVQKLRWPHGTNRVNCVYFGNGGAGSGQFFIDNVKVTTAAGLAESRRRGFGKEGQGDLRVFVDGRLKLERMKLRPQDTAIPLDIELGPEDRFLTLVGSGDENVQLGNWIVFGDPVLEMTASEDSKGQ